MTEIDDVSEKHKVDSDTKPRYSKIYDKQSGQWVEVGADGFQIIVRFRNNIRKQMKEEKRCSCPQSKWWYCDGMCQDCKYSPSDEVASLDELYAGPDGSTFRLSDLLVDTSLPVSEACVNQLFAQKILNRLRELMPEALTIGRLRLLGMTDEAIAKEVGIPRTTFLYQLDKAWQTLQEEFGSDLII